MENSYLDQCLKLLHARICEEKVQEETESGALGQLRRSANCHPISSHYKIGDRYPIGFQIVQNFSRTSAHRRRKAWRKPEHHWIHIAAQALNLTRHLFEQQSPGRSRLGTKKFIKMASISSVCVCENQCESYRTMMVLVHRLLNHIYISYMIEWYTSELSIFLALSLRCHVQFLKAPAKSCKGFLPKSGRQHTLSSLSSSATHICNCFADTSTICTRV